MKDDRTDAPSPPARPPQSPARLYSGHRRRHRSREQDCSRQPSHRGFPATASTAPDPPLQRSASSIPPQNHQENLSSARVFTQPGSRAVLLASSGRPKSVSAVPPIPGMTVVDRSTYAQCQQLRCAVAAKYVDGSRNLLEHLISLDKQSIWQLDAEGLRSFLIDDQFIVERLLCRRVPGQRPPEHLVDVYSGKAMHL